MTANGWHFGVITVLFRRFVNVAWLILRPTRKVHVRALFATVESFDASVASCIRIARIVSFSELLRLGRNVRGSVEHLHPRLFAFSLFSGLLLFKRGSVGCATFSVRIMRLASLFSWSAVIEAAVIASHVR
jgi:hypothetical protein